MSSGLGRRASREARAGRLARLRSGRRVALAAGLLLLALGAFAAVVVAGGDDGGGGGAPADARGHAGTQRVERRTLVDRATLDGTLGYGSEAAAMDRLGGTITWLPAAGALIRPGRPLFAVDGEPVILMDGRVPAWRTLAAGMADGADVEQLERNLAALGYDPGTVDESFTPATAAAVSRWQEALGLTRTGRVELGRVVFLRGERRVAAVDATLGSAAGGGGNAPAAWDGGAHYAYASYETPTAATTPATTPTTPTTPSTTPTTPATTPTTPRPTPSTPRTTPTPREGGGSPSGGGSPAAGGGSGDDGSGGDGGDGGGSGSAATKVLTTTSTARVVTAKLDASEQQLARVGVHAVVTLPGGRRVGGRIVRVGTVASSSSDDEGGAGGAGGDGGGETTLPLTIRLRSTRAAGRLDSAPVSVELARATRRDVLAVPVEALLARSGGGYAVRVRRASGADATVPVEPGLFADGYVELTGGDVRAGDRVEVPR